MIINFGIEGTSSNLFSTLAVPLTFNLADSESLFYGY